MSLTVVVDNPERAAQTYCSINNLVLIVLMGCRQSFPERHLDTLIPFITGNVTVLFKHLPQIYIGLSLVLAFLFEQDIDWTLLSSVYFIWLYMRLFMRNKASGP